MTKKFLTCGIVAMILFFSTTFCFAAQDNSVSNKSDLGSELTQSMNKIEKTANDITNNDNNDRDKNTATGAITDNKINRDYNATRTAVGTDLTNTTNMNGTTWMWIILAVVGVVILATIWVYAMQNTGND